MNAIQSFAIQLWNDLRVRRLLPVAGVLLAGLVAAPILLSKKADEPQAPTPGPAADRGQPTDRPGPDELAQVKLEDVLAKGNGSSLSSFDVSDPFLPPKQVVEAADDAAQTDTGAAPFDTGTGTATTIPDTGAPATGGGETGGTTPDNGTGDNGTGDKGTKTTEFAYVLDVTFWANGRKRTVQGMEKLDILPNRLSPLLIYMGVDSAAANAVFLVDSTLSASGEGTCTPSATECAFVAVGAGSEEQFTNAEGDTYKLRIDEIRKVKVDNGADQGSQAARKKKERKQSKAAHAAVGAPGPTRRFALPTLTDLIVVSGVDGDNSTGDKNRR